MKSRFKWMLIITLGIVSIIIACLVVGEIFMFLVSDGGRVTRGVIFLGLGYLFINEMIETFKYDKTHKTRKY